MSETTSGYGFVPGARSTLFVPDQLIAGNLKLVTDTVTIGSSQTLIRGAVLGRVTASGNYILSVATATDGSQIPAAILVDNVTTAAGATQTAGVYVQGEFNANYLTFDASWTVDTLKAAIRSTLFIKTALSGVPV